MAEIFELLKSPAWWFQAVIVGVAVNLVSNLISSRFKPSPLWLDVVMWAYFVVTIFIGLYALASGIKVSPRVHLDGNFAYYLKLMDNIAACILLPLGNIMFLTLLTSQLPWEQYTKMPATLVVAILFLSSGVFMVALGAVKPLDEIIRLYLVQIAPGIALAAIAGAVSLGIIRFWRARKSTNQVAPRAARPKRAGQQRRP